MQTEIRTTNRKYMNRTRYLWKVIDILRHRGFYYIHTFMVEFVKTVKATAEEIKVPFVLNSYEIEYIWQKLLE